MLAGRNLQPKFPHDVLSLAQSGIENFQIDIFRVSMGYLRVLLHPGEAAKSLTFKTLNTGNLHDGRQVVIPSQTMILLVLRDLYSTFFSFSVSLSSTCGLCCDWNMFCDDEGQYWPVTWPGMMEQGVPCSIGTFPGTSTHCLPNTNTINVNQHFPRIQEKNLCVGYYASSNLCHLDDGQLRLEIIYCQLGP